jgi:6-phosphogluconolactonase
MPRTVAVTYSVSPTPAAVAEAAARFFCDHAIAAVKARGVARIAISGGSTPKRMFELLADQSKPFFAEVPWDGIHLFWVDERCVPPTDPESNYRMTSETLLQHVPLPTARVYRMEGELQPEVAAARYESRIRNAHGG